eukprot:TRINITY_DN4065_c0_g1_i1.p1 TRINITY_DN4065_c0_g1~~TRINITY_DN4065_c0_g1_i1.p1  ORF type:complete len:82 (+),score=26.44 TRINITY_DN4065_c0_g1_i1:336-581(+)
MKLKFEEAISALNKSNSKCNKLQEALDESKYKSHHICSDDRLRVSSSSETIKWSTAELNDVKEELAWVKQKEKVPTAWPLV